MDDLQDAYPKLADRQFRLWIAALASEDPNVRARAALEVKSKDDDLAGRALCLAVQSEENRRVKRAMIFAIALMNKRAARNWLGALVAASSDEETLYYGLHHLRQLKLGAPWVARPLLESQYSSVRFAALHLLVHYGERAHAMRVCRESLLEDLAVGQDAWTDAGRGPGLFFKGRLAILEALSDELLDGLTSAPATDSSR